MVQPSLKENGKNFSTTLRRPRNDDSVTSFQSGSLRVKSGASWPTCTDAIGGLLSTAGDASSRHQPREAHLTHGVGCLPVSARTALVTGAGRGIGRATVEMLLARGWRVAAGVRDVERAREEIGELEGLAILPLDVAERDQVRAGVAAAQEHAGGALALVVNNAGYAAMGAQEDADLEAIRAMFETNVFGAAAVVQEALPAMREAGAGVVVAVGSVADILPTPLVGFYNASKAALTSLCQSLAVESRPFGI